MTMGDDDNDGNARNEEDCGHHHIDNDDGEKCPAAWWRCQASLHRMNN